jgi:hypothetical protein
VLACLKGDDLIVANVGDSRAVLGTFTQGTIKYARPVPFLVSVDGNVLTERFDACACVCVSVSMC